MKLNTTVLIDLDNVEQFIESDKFVQFLLNNTTDVGVATFILQSVKRAIKEARE